MLDLCINLVKDAISLVQKSKEIREETKLRISILLETISNVLYDTAIKLEKDEYPHFNCSLMEKMSDHLHYHLTDTVPSEQLDHLHKVLKESSQVEKQFANRKEENVIISLFDASAEFKTISLLLKV